MPNKVLSPPPGYVTPEFPSLHNPSRDFHDPDEAPQLYYSEGIIPAIYSTCG